VDECKPLVGGGGGGGGDSGGGGSGGSGGGGQGGGGGGGGGINGGGGSDRPEMTWRRVEFPLFTDHVEATRFTYAAFLLNKDLEQLLNAHGLLAWPCIRSLFRFN